MSTALAQIATPEKMDRKGFIGGSDIAAILGVSPWKTAYELWEEKTTGWQPETSEIREKVLRRGKKLEPMVIEMLQEEHDVWVLDRNRIHVDEEFPFLRAEIDFECVIDRSLVERVDNDNDTRSTEGFYECGLHLRTPLLNVGNGDVKTVHPYAAKDWGEEGTDEFPVYYGAQFQFGLMVTKRKNTKVGALIGADDLRVYGVDRDEEIIAYIRKAAVDFWFNNIANRVPPPIQTPEDAAKMLRRFQGFTLEADEATQRELRVIKGIKAAEKLLEAKREVSELRVKSALVDAAMAKAIEGDPSKFAIVGGDGKPLMTWNEQTSNRVSQSRLKNEFPSIYEQVIEPSTFRVLRIK